MVKYSDVLRRTFKAMKSPILWGYSGLGALALFACFGIAAVIVYAIDLPGALRGLTPAPAGEVEFLGSMARFYAVMLLGGLPAIPVWLFVYAGFITVSDAVLAERPVALIEAFGAAARGFGRLLGIEVLLYVAYMAAAAVAAIPFAALVIGGIALTGDSENPIGSIGAVCFGYLWLLVAIAVVIVVYMGVETMASRYGLIGGRTVTDALSSGWKAFRARWKNVVVFGLIVLGLSYAWSFVTSIVMTPLIFLGMPGLFSAPESASLDNFMDVMLLIYALQFALTIPAYVFMGTAWTSFFRQLTGLDAVAPTYQPTPANAPTFPAQPPVPPRATTFPHE